MEHVKVWEEITIIPTYEVGEVEKNPMFLDNRVYQGSSGKVYPYPIIEKIMDEKIEKEYHAVYLENEYIKIMVLPELGGRIQRAYDKTNDYDFVYYNRVIKPALVGLTGPWISGGIEFNWPQHHRPTTFLPASYQLKQYEDGSKSVLINDIDRINGTKAIAEFRLYPDKAYIEIRGQLYNRTPLPQTFLWWANPAIAANEHTRSIFPPDVNAVMDHGKRDVSAFPIAHGIYYKHDYSAGVDISRYQNIPVPTSYMAEKSEYDFIGAYDYNKQAGLLHVADHHISPGKKQWTWGCGDFGKAWERNLTDEDGPYIELMTGVYTDNQPDFTWLKPFEEKTFYQYFMPYKQIGAIKNASIHAALNVEIKKNQIQLLVYATESYKGATITVYHKAEVIFVETVDISPTAIYDKEIAFVIEKEEDMKVSITHGGTYLVEYQPIKQCKETLPEPAKEVKHPEEIATNEELYLAGLHLEQYRHATYLPEDYYLEGIKRDLYDSRINNAYGALLLRRGCFFESTQYFENAIKRLTNRNPNPYDAEPYYHLGLSLLYQKREKEAYDAFYKATWSKNQQEMSFYYLGVLAARKEKYEEAIAFFDQSLLKNVHNIKARGLKAYLLMKSGRVLAGKQMVEENLQVDPFDYVSLYVSNVLDYNENVQEQKQIQVKKRMGGIIENYLQTAKDFAEVFGYREALEVLGMCDKKSSLLYYYEAYYYGCLYEEEKSKECLVKAESYQGEDVFPNALEDILVLEYAISVEKETAKASYYLGNLYYDKKQYKKAREYWEKAREIDATNPTVHRNLSLAYYNKFQMYSEAKESMEIAFSFDTTDARIFLELDQLYKKLGMSCEERLANYLQYEKTVDKRDDLCVEYITLFNTVGRYKEALPLLMNRKFHPWEGGEGKVTTQYTTCLFELAKEYVEKENYEKAKEYLLQALVYPDHLGEGKLEGTKDNHIYYYLGMVYDKCKEPLLANDCYEKATMGQGEIASMKYYNDQPADMILYQGLSFLKLGLINEAKHRFEMLIAYGKEHEKDLVRTEYFAVSLPDFIVYEDDLTKRNEVHCNYLIALGLVGLSYLLEGKKEEAKSYLRKVLEMDKNHQNARLLLRDIEYGAI